MKCMICGEEVEKRRMAFHVTRTHKMKSKDYYDSYLRKDGEGSCLKCGKSTTFHKFYQGYKKYCSNKCQMIHQSETGFRVYTKKVVLDTEYNDKSQVKFCVICGIKRENWSRKTIRYTCGKVECRNKYSTKKSTEAIRKKWQEKEKKGKYLRKNDEGADKSQIKFCVVCGVKRTNWNKYIKTSTCGSKKCGSVLMHSKATDEKKLARAIKQREIMTNIWATEEFREKNLRALKEAHNRPEVRKKHSETTTKVWSNPELRKKMSELSLARWKDEEWVKKTVDSIRKSMAYLVTSGNPNKSEQIVLDILERLFPNDFKYTGDLILRIDGKNPDFVYEGKKKIIEYYGYTWHKGDTEEHTNNRIECFRRCGYDTLIIWDFELKTSNLEVLEAKLKEFVNG